MPFVGNKSTTRDKDACWKDYQQLQKSASYQDCWNKSTVALKTAQEYVHQLFQEAPHARLAVQEGKLAVVTGVHADSVAYHIAKELAVQAGMHVMVLGKSESGLKKCCTAIQNAKRSGQAHNKEEEKHEEPSIVLFTQKFRLDSLSVIESAAAQITQICQQKYNGQLHVLVNAASVGSEQARLTEDGIEYNTGCNFIGTHHFTTLLLPLLKNAACSIATQQCCQRNRVTCCYKPRVTCVASIGHALGTNFNPQRLVEHPKEGGAPPGYIVVQEGFGVEHVVTIHTNEEDANASNNNNNNTPMSQAELADAVSKRGSQVGRSKMALVADVIHWARLYPEINFTSHYPGTVSTSAARTTKSIDTLFRKVFAKKRRHFTAAHGARAALRAALDPDMNTPDLQGGAYLHCDGDPWVPMDPASDPRFAQACYEAAEQVIAKLTKEASYEPPAYVKPAEPEPGAL